MATKHICENGVCHIIKEEDKPKIDDSERTKCEIWTRVMGYHRPVSQWNKGKKSEFKERKYFSETVTLNSLNKYKEAGNA